MHGLKDKRELMELSNEKLVDLVISQRLTIENLKSELFGRKSEKRKTDPEGMTPLFNEAETVHLEEVETVATENSESSNGGKKGKGRTGGVRKPLPKDLPRERVVYDLPEDQKICPRHGQALIKIGEKVKEELKIIPSQLKVVEHVTLTYKCSCCLDDDNPDTKLQAVTQSERAPSIIPKSIASASLLAFIVVAKFQDSLPLYRLSGIFKRYGIDLSRTLMANWMLKVSDITLPLINLMWDTLKDSGAVGCDETPVQVLKEPDRRPEQRSYMWAATTTTGPPVVLFEYDTGRGAKVADRLFSGFEGTIVCDGLRSYDAFARTTEGKVELGACLAHIRRKFYQADRALRKAAPKAVPKTTKPLDIISKLYNIEDQLRGKSPEHILKARSSKSKILMEELKLWLDDHQGKVLPKSLVGRAITYALDQWPKMQVFLRNSSVPIDNNSIERYIRQFVIGRNNWVFSTSQHGAIASARLYSLVQSAKANGLDPFSYLTRIFKELPKATSLDDYEKLLPFNANNHFEIKPFQQGS